jgi:TetR/AcrR family transcriptional regulator, transcriptional repressor for nem operon
MPHSATTERPGKRDRLVASARDLLHRQGVERTTLAQIAQAAEVPPGNVYYYFKTRDELVGAVIESRLEQIRGLLGRLEQRSTPRARLKALARTWADVGEMVAQYGCPIGSLSSELNKQSHGLDEPASEMLRFLLDWASRQFREMGRRDARDMAESMLARVQGAALLANTLRDPKIMTREVRRLDRWIDSLAP